MDLMTFDVWYLKDLDDEFEDPEQEYIEAPTWLMALQRAEAKASKLNKHLAQMSRLS